MSVMMLAAAVLAGLFIARVLTTGDWSMFSSPIGLSAAQLSRAFESYDAKEFRRGNEATSLLHDKRYLEALRLFEEVISARQRIVPPPDMVMDNHNRMAVIYNSMAVAHLGLGHFDEAETFFSTALQYRKNHIGVDDPGIVSILINKVELYVQQSKYTEAQAALAEAISTFATTAYEAIPYPHKSSAEIRQSDIHEILVSSASLGILLRKSGLPDAALSVYKQEAKFRDKLDTTDLDAASDYAFHANIGMAYKTKGDLEQAMNHLEKSASLFKLMAGPELSKHAMFGTYLSNLQQLAELSLQITDETKAAQYATEALEVSKSYCDDEHPFRLRMNEILNRIVHAKSESETGEHDKRACSPR